MSVRWWEVLAGAALDLALGDPRGLPHPVRGFGRMAAWLEAPLRRTGLGPRAAGVLYCVLLVAVAGGLVWITLPWANIYWIYALLAVRDLDVEAGAVVTRLAAGDLAGAREKLAWIVGRDTAELDEPAILRAVIETVGENLSDAVVAPLFWLALAGPAGMAAYKAANTLDSMVGYRNERYREFGWAAARLDDLVNWAPARLTAALVWLCAPALGLDARRSVRVTWRDGAGQPSPNSGYPEAAVAGALGVRLGGLNYYGGVPAVKAFLGDPARPLTRATFRGARRLLYGTSALAVLLVCGVVR